MPQRDFNMAGEDWTSRYRLRPGFFGAVLEQLVERQDGSSEWRPARWPIEIKAPAPP